jgi:hypothetical protein
MTRQVTLKEFLLEEINRELREEGRDIQVVFARPRPRLANRGEVVPLRAASTEENANG